MPDLDLYCTACAVAIRAEGLTFKQRMPKRAVVKLAGTPLCSEHAADEVIANPAELAEADRELAAGETVSLNKFLGDKP